jgi:hypothetical protein
VRYSNGEEKKEQEKKSLHWFEGSSPLGCRSTQEQKESQVQEGLSRQGKARSMTNKTRFKVGDLVKIADWCLNKGLTGVVTKVKPWSVSQDVYVCFPGHDREKYVQKNNLILIARG